MIKQTVRALALLLLTAMVASADTGVYAVGGYQDPQPFWMDVADFCSTGTCGSSSSDGAASNFNCGVSFRVTNAGHVAIGVSTSWLSNTASLLTMTLWDTTDSSKKAQCTVATTVNVQGTYSCSFGSAFALVKQRKYAVTAFDSTNGNDFFFSTGMTKLGFTPPALLGPWYQIMTGRACSVTGSTANTYPVNQDNNALFATQAIVQ